MNDRGKPGFFSAPAPGGWFQRRRVRAADRACPEGFEPSSTGLEPVMLPLHQGHEMRGVLGETSALASLEATNSPEWRRA